MAEITLLAALVIVTVTVTVTIPEQDLAVIVPQQEEAVILVILIVAIIAYQNRRPQVELDTRQDLPPVTSESNQSLEPAAGTTPASTRPTTLRRRNCFVLGQNGLTSEPLSSDPELCSSSDSEGYETASEDAAPPRTMAEKRALKYFEDRLSQHRETVSSETSARPPVQTSLTDAQIREDHSDADDAEMIKRRNIKMREEGVRVKVNNSQLSSLKPTPARQPAPAALSNASEGLRGGASGTTFTPCSSSPPSSCLSTTPSLSGLQSPPPTRCGDITGITTPDHAPSSASVLPTSGQAAEVLYRIDEKLLAIPADAVSRRLLRDGRAVLHGRKRLPRSVSSAEASPSPLTPAPIEAGLETYDRYPSEMMKE